MPNQLPDRKLTKYLFQQSFNIRFFHFFHLLHICPFRMAGCKAFRHGNGKNMHIRMLFQQPSDAPLVLRRGKGTGRIAEPSAGTEHLICVFQNLSLPFGAHLHIFRAPLLSRRLVFPEHSLSGTGGIHQNPVKKAGKTVRQPVRRFV